MATFNVGRQIIGPKVAQRGGVVVDYSVNMVASGRRLHDSPSKLTLEQPFIVSDAEWATAETFFKQNSDKEFTFPWDRDGQSYTMRFLAPLRRIRGDLAPGYSYMIASMGEV